MSLWWFICVLAFTCMKAKCPTVAPMKTLQHAIPKLLHTELAAYFCDIHVYGTFFSILVTLVLQYSINWYTQWSTLLWTHSSRSSPCLRCRILLHHTACSCALRPQCPSMHRCHSRCYTLNHSHYSHTLIVRRGKGGRGVRRSIIGGGGGKRGGRERSGGGGVEEEVKEKK